jgi:HTH-type transcriptional regulator, competence development regulator
LTSNSNDPTIQEGEQQEGSILAMKFTQKLRELRLAKNLSQRALAAKVGVDFTYVSKIENEKLDFAQYPSEELILKLAKVLDADADELLLLAQKVPPIIKKRVMERPDEFLRIARMDDRTLNRLLAQIGK